MNAHKSHKRQGKARWIGAVAFCLALLLLLTACAPGADASQDSDTSDQPFIVRPQNDKYLRQDEWVRMLALAIRHADYRDQIWQAIPASQRSEIGQADFIRYIDFLADCLPGSVIAFTQASDEEADAIRSHAGKAEKLLVPKPDQAAIWWIKAQTSDLRELKFAVPVTLDEGGIPYFSKSWLQKQATLYDYIVLYLDALSLNSKAALTALLSHNQTIRSTIQKQAIDRRADHLLTYYSQKVSNVKDGYRCVEMMPGYAMIEEPVSSTEPGVARIRTVVFTESEGLFRAEEKIPQELTLADADFFFNGKALFDDQEDPVQVSSETCLPLLGIPLHLEWIDKESAQEGVFRVTWPGLVLEASGECDPETLVFEGRVRQISVSYSLFQTGSGLKPGDSIYELYLRYPFARESGYLISLKEGDRKRTLAIQVESDAIARLTLIFDS